MAKALSLGLAALLLALFTGSAIAQEVSARDAAGQRPATVHEIKAFLADVAMLLADLDQAKTLVEGRHRDWGWREDECRYQSLQADVWTAREERLTANCAAHKAGIDLGHFLAVGYCESNYNRLAYNPNGPYVGIYQHAASSYVSRIKTYEPVAWDKPLSTKWQNSRGQIVMSARMAKAVGWEPWTCA